jgi:hypothetical protein
MMPIDFSDQLYVHTQDTYGRAISITPGVSQPGGPDYVARGILDTKDIDVVALDGSIISEQHTILDIREAEFGILPMQGDQVAIPGDSGLPDAGLWEIIDVVRNGGGETTLTLRKVMAASKPSLKLVKAK